MSNPEYFSLTLNPQDKNKMPEEPESYLPDPKTNPAAYPEEAMAPMPKKDVSSESVEGTPEADALKGKGTGTPISGAAGTVKPAK
jgi:hypothetical protein